MTFWRKAPWGRNTPSRVERFALGVGRWKGKPGTFHVPGFSLLRKTQTPNAKRQRQTQNANAKRYHSH